MRCALAAVALCLVLVLPVRAQQPPPSVSDTADRPGFADSPVLLGRGHIQVESGLAWEHAGRGADLTKTLTWPQLELHAGLAPRLEVSLAWDGLVSSVSNPEGRSTGGADVRLGAKFGLVNRPGVDAALIGYVELPVGSGSVSSGYADPLARFAWGISVAIALDCQGPRIWEPRVSPMAESGRNRRSARPWGRPWCERSTASSAWLPNHRRSGRRLTCGRSRPASCCHSACAHRLTSGPADGWQAVPTIGSSAPDWFVVYARPAASCGPCGSTPARPVAGQKPYSRTAQ